MAEPTKFSAYPWHALPKRTRHEAALESLIAQHLTPVRVCVVRAHTRPPAFDADAPSCEWRVAGLAFDVRGSAAFARDFADRTLGGMAELAAPRPLGLAEHALWALVVARWLHDFGLPGEVWPRLEPSPLAADALAVELLVDGATVLVFAPRELELRAPRRRELPRWTAVATVDAQVVVARCALPRPAVHALTPGDLVTVERAGELGIFGGAVGLSMRPGAVVAEVATGYVPRAVLADDADVELTVSLGTTRLTLRAACELAVGQIIQLGRPLAGPFEVHAAGRLLGRGELVDVDGELAVRIVSLEERS